MNIFNIFKKREPVIGEKWGIKSRTPWENSYDFARIIDIKDGWVRYKRGEVKAIEIREFIKMYEAVDK